MKAHIIVRLIVDVEWMGQSVEKAQEVLEKAGFKTSRGTDYDLIAEKDENRTH